MHFGSLKCIVVGALAATALLSGTQLLVTEIPAAYDAIMHAGLVEEVLGLDLPKPHQIRLGNWERRPLSDEQKQYAALDAFASLLLHWELQALPERLTLSQQLRAAMRERAAAAIAATSDA